MTIETILIAGTERGLTYDAMSNMTIGQVVDYVIEYNNRNSDKKKKEKPNVRKATREDYRAFFGV